MADKSKKENRQFKTHKFFSKKKLLIRVLLITIVIMILAVLGFLLISRLTNKTANDGSTTEKVLTIKDIENSDVNLAPDTSDASVKNLTKGLKAEIDKQISTKENPIETVEELAGVLSNTTNQKRQDQLTNFVEDFLANHEDELWLKHSGNIPDQAQVNYWKGELYAYLVYNFNNILENRFTDADGKLIDTTKEQLKYIDLYLKLANDPKSHIVISEKDREVLTDYVYDEANDFLELKNELITRDTI